MTIIEFTENYCLHDSTIRNITYNKPADTLTFLIDFAFWMQDWYVDGSPENGMVNLHFSGVKDYSGLTGEIDWFSIQAVNDNRDGSLTFVVLDDFNETQYLWRFSTSDVTFEDLNQYE